MTTRRYPRYDLLLSIDGGPEKPSARSLYRLDAARNMVAWYAKHYPTWRVRIWDRKLGQEVA